MRNYFAKQNTDMQKGASKRSILGLVLLSFCLIFGTGTQSMSQSSDEQDWWFNIELIAFSRVMSPSNTEDFSSSELSIDFSNSHPLLHVAALQQTFPNGVSFPLCDVPSALYPDIDVSFTYRPEELFGRIDTNPIMSKSSSENNRIDDLDAQSLDNTKKANTTINKLPLQTQLNELLKFTQFINSRPQASQQNKQAELQNQLPLQMPSDVDVVIKTRNEALDSIDQQLQVLNLFFEDFANIQRVDCRPNTKVPAGFNPYALKEIPQTLFSKQSFFTGDTQLLSSSEAFLKDYAQSVFKQRDINPLLHTAWRHNIVFGAENAQFFRVRAGKLLEVVNEQTYEQWHQSYLAQANLSDTEAGSDLFSSLKSAITNNENVNWLALETNTRTTQKKQNDERKEYELDGIFKVFLDYVNQVPYLHIESEFAHYRMALDSDGRSYLQKYSSKQRRRIISKQIHYFDHPAFGIVVRLERFTPPDPTSVPEA